MAIISLICIMTSITSGGADFMYIIIELRAIIVWRRPEIVVRHPQAARFLFAIILIIFLL
jgi:hypothetical protein